jgi:hypothetical protein
MPSYRNKLLKYRILVGRLEGKRLLRRPRYRWEDNIRIDLREKGWEGVDWMHLAQERVQWEVLAITVVNLSVPQKAGSYLTS